MLMHSGRWSKRQRPGGGRDATPPAHHSSRSDHHDFAEQRFSRKSAGLLPRLWIGVRIYWNLSKHWQEDWEEILRPLRIYERDGSERKTVKAGAWAAVNSHKFLFGSYTITQYIRFLRVREEWTKKQQETYKNDGRTDRQCNASFSNCNEFLLAL